MVPAAITPAVPDSSVVRVVDADREVGSDAELTVEIERVLADHGGADVKVESSRNAEKVVDQPGRLSGERVAVCVGLGTQRCLLDPIDDVDVVTNDRRPVFERLDDRKGSFGAGDLMPQSDAFLGKHVGQWRTVDQVSANPVEWDVEVAQDS